MPNWKKVLTSGSAGELSSLYAPSITGSLQGTSSWSTNSINAVTASYVNTLNQNVLITGSLTVSTSSIGPSENTLTLGARDAVNEGAQLGFNAPGGTYTSASMIDNYQNRLRILRGTNAGSTGEVASWNLHTLQLSLPSYTSVTSYTGTVAGILGFDSSGNVITTSPAGLSGGSTNYLARWDGPGTLTTGSVFDTGTAVGIGNISPSYKLDVSGDIRSTGVIYANANGGMYFQGGDDAALYDINAANTMGIYGQQTVTEGAIKLGSEGAVLYGSGSKLGIGTTNPNSASLHVNGNVFATSFTGSLQGTASFATSASQAISASFITGSNVFGPYGSNSVISSSYAETASFSLATTENRILVLNQSGYTISKGIVVHITGSNNSSDIPRIVSASYESDAYSANTLGIASQTITNGNTGYVTTEGVLTGIDTSAFTSGQLVYLGAAGSIIGTAPLAPLHAVRLGQIVREQSNVGSMYVRIDNGYELGELHDTIDTTTSTSYGDLLVKSGSVWTNSRQLTGSYGITGSLIISGSGVNELQIGTNKLFVSASGNIGIGITSPTAKLHINNINEGHSFLVEDSTNPDASPFVIDKDGNVGVGTETLTSALSTDARVLAIRDTAPSNNVGSFRAYGGGTLTSIELFAAPSLVGLYGSTNTPMIFSANSTERMRISADGNVGIGTTNPINPLHIRKTASSILLDGLRVERDPSTTSTAIFNANGGATNVISNSGVTNSFNPITFRISDNTTTTEVMRITNEGNVGIGISTPTARLHITHTDASDAFKVEDDTNPDSTPFVIDANGSVGIGNPSPSATSAKLTVQSSDTDGTIRIGGGNGAGNARLFLQSSATNAYIDMYGNNQYLPLRIDAAPLSLNSAVGSGNVGIGTDSPSSKLDVTSTSAGSVINNITVQNASNTINTEAGIFFAPTSAIGNIRGSRITGYQEDGNNLIGLKFYTGAGATISERVRIAANGWVGINKLAAPNAGLDVNGNTIITGSLTVTNDFTVLGSASIQYVTSSQLNINDNIITVNTYSPAFQFGGLAVIDSGSGTPLQSGSMLFNSEQNEWIYVHKMPAGSAITSSLVIMGPQTYDAVGSEIHPTTNRIMKSIVDEHIGDSNITDTGTLVSINSNTQITGSLLITGSTSTDLVKITQTGGGHAFTVYDAPGTDGTAFIIDSSGSVGIGINSIYSLGTFSSKLYVANDISGFAGITGVGNNNHGIIGKGSTDWAGVYGLNQADGFGTQIGVYGKSTIADTAFNGTTWIGGKFEALGDVFAGPSYAVQLIDGTEAAGKVLVSQTADGKGNWSTRLSGSYEVTGSMNISGELRVGGMILGDSGIQLSGSSNINGDTTITGSLTVTGNLGGSGGSIDMNAMIQASLLYLSNNF